MAGIYIHVPFCKKRCIYCDFFTRTDLSLKTEYVSAICKEIELRKEYIKGETIETIYFGGGTPSQLLVNDFEHIFNAIYTNFRVDADAEITIEGNPDDLSIHYLKSIQALPINRLSIGIQSFNNAELSFLDRRHSAETAKEVVHFAKKIGFDNISIDLMYGLPNQTLDVWTNNLEEAIALNIQHISAYHLIYEEGTKLFRLQNQKKIKPVDENISVEMFSIMIDKLANAGFELYEISNFCQKGFTSRHNSSYWLGKKYLGLGPSAHSFDGTNRAWNVASIPLYIKGVLDSSLNIEIEYLDQKTSYNDFIITGLRTKWGLDIKVLENKFGSELKKYCLNIAEKYIAKELLNLNNNKLTLTRQGIFVSDGIMSDLMYVD